MPVKWYFITLGRTTHQSRDIKILKYFIAVLIAVLAKYILRSRFPLYFYLKSGLIIKAPQMLDGIKTAKTNMRLSKPCKFHWSTRYHTYAVLVQQDSRVRTLTPTRLRRVGVSVYTSFKMRFCSWEFFEPSFGIYIKFGYFFIIAQKFQLKNF